MAAKSETLSYSGTKDELEADAKKFREAARLIGATAGQNEEITQLSQWLMQMSDSFQNVSGGYDQNAAPTSYDDDKPLEEDVKAKADEDADEKDEDEGVKRTVSHGKKK